MIAKATAISHDINALRYITGESTHKKHPEKIHPIATYFFDGAFTARSMFEAIKFKCADYPRLKNNIIRIEISPAEEYTHNFTAADWKRLWEEFAEEFDNQEILDEKTGKVISPKTHITRSKATVWLHRDSRSGIPHLHAAVCRVDESGELNNDYQIHLRRNVPPSVLPAGGVGQRQRRGTMNTSDRRNGIVRRQFNLWTVGHGQTMSHCLKAKVTISGSDGTAKVSCTAIRSTRATLLSRHRS